MTTPKFNEQAACDKCGKIGGYDLTTTILCGECWGKDDGARPAFPVSQEYNTAGEPTCAGWGGMTLRDYFAAKAMQAILTATINDFVGGEKEFIASTLNTAKQSYQIADAMIAARKGNS